MVGKFGVGKRVDSGKLSRESDDRESCSREKDVAPPSYPTPPDSNHSIRQYLIMPRILQNFHLEWANCWSFFQRMRSPSKIRWSSWWTPVRRSPLWVELFDLRSVSVRLKISITQPPVISKPGPDTIKVFQCRFTLDFTTLKCFTRNFLIKFLAYQNPA